VVNSSVNEELATFAQQPDVFEFRLNPDRTINNVIRVYYNAEDLEVYAPNSINRTETAESDLDFSVFDPENVDPSLIPLPESGSTTPTIVSPTSTVEGLEITETLPDTFFTEVFIELASLFT
jgi:hypothetical protein